MGAIKSGFPPTPGGPGGLFRLPSHASGRGEGEGSLTLLPNVSDHAAARRLRRIATAPPIAASRPAPGVGTLVTLSANFMSL